MAIIDRSVEGGESGVHGGCLVGRFVSRRVSGWMFSMFARVSAG